MAPDTSTSSTASDRSHHDDERPLIGRNVVWGLAAGGSSTVVHLALLLILGLMINSLPPKERVVCGGTIEEPLDPMEITEKLEKPIHVSQNPNTAPGATSNPQGPQGVAGAVSAAVQKPKLNTKVTDRMTDQRIDPGVNNIFASSGTQLVEAAPFGTLSLGPQAAKDYGDAMDRITQEVLIKLAKQKVLLVWIFDQSDSMEDDREEITLRIDRVYQELGLTAASKGNALLTGVTSYGADFKLHTPQPTSNTTEIMAAIKSVPNDPSGKEKMCLAVTSSIAHFQRMAQQQDRQLMCVLVTDESGDQDSNFTDLEQTIQTAVAARSIIYVLGREAVFGYPYAHVRWVDPGTKYNFWIRIDRGPETPYPEQLQVDGFHRRFDAHPSGFGPYEQSRMARQTGGVFFMLPSPESNLVGRQERDYDPDSMRAYMPDLSARDAYAAERDKYPMRAMIWKVITDLNPYDKKLEQLVQVKLHDWPIDRAAYAREAETHIKKAEALMQYYAQAQQALESVAKQRDRDPSIRWRANYDVTYAQTIAYQARLRDYIAYVGAFVQNPKAIKNVLGPSRPTDSWDANYVKRTLANDPKTTELRERSAQLYRKIRADHAGTPWAARAELELARHFGIEFHEDHEDLRGRGGVKVPNK